MEPILPAPITPKVFDVNSTPINLDFSHLPLWVDIFASGICLATAIIIEIVCSAVVIEFPNGVFITIIPSFDAAGMLTLSTPIPALPITLSLTACFIIFSVTLVADLMANPS